MNNFCPDSSLRYCITCMTQNLYRRKIPWILIKFNFHLQLNHARLVYRFSFMWITYLREPDKRSRNLQAQKLFIQGLELTLAFVSFPVVFDSVVLLIGLHRSWSSSLRGSVSHWRSRRHCSGSSWMSWGRSWRPNSMRPLRRYEKLTL